MRVYLHVNICLFYECKENHINLHWHWNVFFSCCPTQSYSLFITWTCFSVSLTDVVYVSETETDTPRQTSLTEKSRPTGYLGTWKYPTLFCSLVRYVNMWNVMKEIQEDKMWIKMIKAVMSHHQLLIMIICFSFIVLLLAFSPTSNTALAAFLGKIQTFNYMHWHLSLII